MLVGIGHSHYWAGGGAPPPTATVREGNMHGYDSDTFDAQTTHGAVHLAALLLAVVNWARRLL